MLTQAPKHLVIALRNTLRKLELTVPPDADQVNFAELKRILGRRIVELENSAASLPITLLPAKAKQLMDS
jgi:hypothetical protein